jgi:predicted RNA-binding Zn ribbon-like protein
VSRDPVRATPQFFGGRICLDFANTMDWRTSDAPAELIPDYGALLAWSRARRTMSAPSVARLKAHLVRAPEAAAEIMQTALALRSDIWGVADALRERQPAPLARINRLLARVPAQPPLVRSGAGYLHAMAGSALEEPLWPVLWSLTALLSSDDASRVGCCRGHGCGWFFVDESPNRTRVWCSNETCGNRERARRSYAKRRSAGN